MSIFVQLCPIMSFLSILSNLFNLFNLSILSNFVQFCPYCWKTDDFQFCQIVFNFVQFCPFLSNVIQFCPYYQFCPFLLQFNLETLTKQCYQITLLDFSQIYHEKAKIHDFFSLQDAFLKEFTKAKLLLWNVTKLKIPLSNLKLKCFVVKFPFWEVWILLMS